MANRKQIRSTEALDRKRNRGFTRASDRDLATYLIRSPKLRMHVKEHATAQMTALLLNVSAHDYQTHNKPVKVDNRKAAEKTISQSIHEGLAAALSIARSMACVTAENNY